MANNKTQKEPQGIDKAIAHVLDDMLSTDSDDPKFADMVKNLNKLYKMKTYKKEPFLTPAQWLPVAGNLLGIGLLLSFEKAHVLSSKALGFVLKSKI